MSYWKEVQNKLERLDACVRKRGQMLCVFRGKSFSLLSTDANDLAAREPCYRLRSVLTHLVSVDEATNPTIHRWLQSLRNGQLQSLG